MTAFQIPEQQALEQQEFQDRRRFSIVPIRAANDRRLTAGIWRTLLALCAYSSKGGIVWVSQKRIGQDIGISQPAVHRQIARLKAWGYLERISHSKKGVKAETIRILYAPELQAEDATSIAGETPIHLQQQGESMNKRKRKTDNSHSVMQTAVSQSGMELVDSSINQQSAIAALAAAYRAEGLPVPSQDRLLAEIQGAR